MNLEKDKCRPDTCWIVFFVTCPPIEKDPNNQYC